MQESAQGLPQDDQAGSAHPLIGSICLFVGTVLFCLAIVEKSAGLPFWMPRTWYTSRPLWYSFAAASIVAGGLLLRSRRRNLDEWRPCRAGVRFETVQLYTRTGCHLCDQDKDLLLKYSAYLPQITEVDIESDPELLEAYADCLPVVEIDGKLRFRGGVDESLLRRLIESTRPRS